MAANEGSLLVLVRHGESEWNKLNLFTGWKNPALTEKGRGEALTGAKNLKAAGYTHFDVAFTSVLQRANDTLAIILKEIGQDDLETFKDQALNERDYGDLTGLNKDEARVKFGEEQVHIWRRSYDVPPPGGESLELTAKRVLPYYESHIKPRVAKGEKVLVAAHGNSLRSMIMQLEGLSGDEIVKTELETGVPIVYKLDKDGKVLSKDILKHQSRDQPLVPHPLLGTSSIQTDCHNNDHLLPARPAEPLCVSGDLLVDPSSSFLDPFSSFTDLSSASACTYGPLALPDVSFNPCESLPLLDPSFADLSFLAAAAPEAYAAPSTACDPQLPPAPSAGFPALSHADLPCFPSTTPSVSPPAPLDWLAFDTSTSLFVPSASASASPPSLSPSSSTSTVSPPTTLAPTPSSSSLPPLRPRPVPQSDLAAPIRPRGPGLLPSSTARKALTAKGARLLAKKHAGVSPPAPSASSTATGHLAGSSSSQVKEPAVPADVVAAMERKRVQNTLSARRCRAKKQARVAELEAENEELRRRVEELERRCREGGLEV